MANPTMATEPSSYDPANRRVTKKRMYSEMRAEYYDVPSDCRLFVTFGEVIVLLYISVFLGCK
jgi:hypothetical protein